jgi:tetratricopeptide (TPR) repeat protein/lysophospholipase L1-like esterase
LLALAAPAVVWGITELFLMFSGVVPSGRLLLRVADETGDHWMVNPHYGRVLFQKVGAPLPQNVWVPVEKRPGVRRVVLIGASAAQGYPSPDFSMARVLEAYWNHRVPDQPIAVVDLTMTGINSHVLRRWVRAAGRLDPDMILVYGGHNEVIGPFGPAAVLGRPWQRIEVIRFLMALRETRVGVALQALVSRAAVSSGGTEPAIWRGLGAFGQMRLRHDDPRLDVVERHARRNFADMVRWAVRHDVPLGVIAPASNLKDWPPLHSPPAVVALSDALARERQGETVSFVSGWQAYQFARLLEQRGKTETAWRYYLLARDLDAHRYRADQRVVDAQAEAVAGAGDAGVVFVDGNRALRQGGGDAVEDAALFLEHVHLTFAGRVRLARVLSEVMAGQWGISLSAAEAAAMQQVVAEALLFTPVHERLMLEQILALVRLQPFASQPEAGQRQQRLADRIGELAALQRDQWDASAVDTAIAAAVTVRPQDPMVHVTAATRLVEQGRLEEAVAHARQALALNPYHREALHFMARTRLDERSWEEAAQLIDRLAFVAPDNPSADLLRAEWLIQQERHTAALPLLETAVAIRSVDPRLHYFRGLAYQQVGEGAAAVAAFRQCLTFDPRNAAAMARLALLLYHEAGASSQTLAEALRLIDTARMVDPDNAHVREVVAALRQAGAVLD